MTTRDAEGTSMPPSPSRITGHGAQPETPDVLGAFWRYRWAVILPAIFGAVAGFLVYLQMENVYRSTTRLMLETDQPAILDTMTGDLVGGVPSIDIIESQLYSDDVIRMAFDDPLMQPFRGEFNDDIEVFARKVQKWMVLEPEVEDLATAQSLVMLLHFDSKSKDLSHAAVRAFSSALEEFLNARSQTSQKELMDLITDAIQEQIPKLEQAEEAYREFRRQHTELAWDANGEAINPHREQQLVLVKRRSELVDQLGQKTILYGAVESVAKDSKDPLVALGVVSQLLGVQIQIPEMQAQDFASMVRDGDLKLAEIDVDKELIPLMIQRNKFAAEFGDNHPTVKQLDAELTLMKAELKRLVTEETDQILKLIEENRRDVLDPSKRAREAIGAVMFAAKSEMELLNAKIAQIDTQIDQEKQDAIKLAHTEQQNLELLREIERRRQFLDQLDERMTQVEVTDNQGASTRVTTLKAASKSYLVGPILLKMLAIGTFLGLVAGSGLALFLEKNASTFRTPEEVSAFLGIPVLTHVPFFKGSIRKSKKGEHNPHADLDPYLSVVHQPSSVVSEAIRSFRTSVFFELPGPKCNIIQVTSPLPGDGKSTIAGNLACSIAQSGKRVLIIDADLRRPQLTDNFNKSSAMGLTNVLNGECDPEDAMHVTSVAHLKVMPSGPIPANPAEALTLPEMAELLDYVRDHFDYIVVDTPPLLVVTDPSIIAGMVDGVVVALRIRRKSKHNAAESANILRSVGARILGVVINNSDESSASDGYRGYGYYRYGRYTNRYYRSTGGGATSGQSTSVIVSGRGRPLKRIEASPPKDQEENIAT